MDLQIKDGTGTGYRAKVNDRHEMHTQAVTYGLMHQASHFSGQSFCAHTGDASLAPTTTGGFVFFIKNTASDKDLVLKRLLGSVTGAMQFLLYGNITKGTLGNNTEVAPVNLNFASANEANAEVYKWDGVSNGITGFTNGTLMAPLLVPGATVLDIIFNDDWIVAPGMNIAIHAKSLTGGPYALQLYTGFYYLDTH